MGVVTVAGIIVGIAANWKTLTGPPTLVVTGESLNAPLNPNAVHLLNLVEQSHEFDQAKTRDLIQVIEKIKAASETTRLDIKPIAAYHNVKVHIRNGWVFSVSKNGQNPAISEGEYQS